MEITPQILISILIATGSLVSVWVALNSKIVRLEKDVEKNETDILNLKNSTERDLQQAKATMSELINKLQHLETTVMAALSRIEAKIEK